MNWFVLTALTAVVWANPQPGRLTPTAPTRNPVIKGASGGPSVPDLDTLCRELDRVSQKFSWNLKPCPMHQLKVKGASVKKAPLVVAEFGPADSTNVTLVLSSVHGDEITPVYVIMRLIEWAQENPAAIGDRRIVIAPLVNPDSFFAVPRTRSNANGVDVNRNLPTKDWNAKALHNWQRKFGSNVRRFPGWKANSEPETDFQVRLIDEYKPTKILSLHAPLNFYDYDGPNGLTLSKFPMDYVSKCLELRSSLKAVSGGFFPGSLGNYAGQERGIPTITLELPTADPKRAADYWKGFEEGIKTVISFEVPDQITARK